MAEQKDKILSASRIKTLETCSWSYWCNYHLKVPQQQNEGALRGTIAHLIFELLLVERHKKHYWPIVKACTIEASPSITRLVWKSLKRDAKKWDLPNMDTQETFELMDQMILVGLNNDFFGARGEIKAPEYEFLLESEEPKYKIRGFMDKPIHYKKKLKIVDYKSSKYKFRGEELTSNIQAMAYSLAAKKIWPNHTPEVEFLFLRHGRSPAQNLKFNNDQLFGFEYFLAEVFAKINNFTEEDAKSNYAKGTKKNSWMCKIGSWRCPYLESYAYWQLLDKDDKVIKGSLKDDLVAEEGQKVVKKFYDGCPAHAKKSSDDDLFDF